MIANAISQYENEVSAWVMELDKSSICRQTGDKWYMRQIYARSKVIAFENKQIMKPPISIEGERILEIRQYKTMCGEMQKWVCGYKEKVDGIGSNDCCDNYKDITTKMLKHCLYVR